MREELSKLFDGQSARQAVAAMVGRKIGPVSFDGPEKWERAGGESYILPFVAAQKETGTPIVRALFKANTTMNPERAITQGVEKRHMLEKLGVKTPRLYGYGGGVVLEEFLPHDVDEALNIFGNKIFQDIAYAYGAIASGGFSPVANGLIRDFRADNDGNMHMIDFGSDLGEPSETPTDLWGAFKIEMKKRFGITDEQVSELRMKMDNPE